MINLYEKKLQNFRKLEPNKNATYKAAQLFKYFDNYTILLLWRFNFLRFL